MIAIEVSMLVEGPGGVGVVLLVIVVVVPKDRTLRERSVESIDEIKQFREKGMGVSEISS